METKQPSALEQLDTMMNAIESPTLPVPATLPREIVPGIFWLGNCSVQKVQGRGVHGHHSSFLIRGGTCSLLVDTGPPQIWETLSRTLDEYLGGEALDFVAPTHPEIPHSGCLGKLLAKYPNALAIGDMRDFHLYYPDITDRLKNVTAGYEIDLGAGYVYRVLPAIIKDMPNTLWGYEASQRVLFVADGFSYVHHPEAAEAGFPIHMEGECGRLTTELGDFPNVSQVVYYSAMALYWTRFRDNADSLFERLRAMLHDQPVSIIAPAHGNVIDDPDRVIPIVKEAHRVAFRMNQVGRGAPERGTSP